MDAAFTIAFAQATEAKAEATRLRTELEQTRAELDKVKLDLTKTELKLRSRSAKLIASRLASKALMRHTMFSGYAESIVFPLLMKYGFDHWAASGYSFRVVLGTVGGEGPAKKLFYGFKVKMTAENKYEVSSKLAGSIDMPIPELAGADGVPAYKAGATSLDEICDIIDKLIVAVPAYATEETAEKIARAHKEARDARRGDMMAQLSALLPEGLRVVLSQ